MLHNYGFSCSFSIYMYFVQKARTQSVFVLFYLDLHQSLFYFVPHDSHRQAGLSIFYYDILSILYSYQSILLAPERKDAMLQYNDGEDDDEDNDITTFWQYSIQSNWERNGRTATALSAFYLLVNIKTFLSVVMMMMMMILMICYCYWNVISITP